MYEYKVELNRVIDADTFVFIADLGFDIRHRITVRTCTYDAPEIRGEERERGLIMRGHALEILLKAEEIIVRTHSKGKYGRWIGCTLVDGIDIEETLMKIEASKGWDK